MLGASSFLPSLLSSYDDEGGTITQHAEFHKATPRRPSDVTMDPQFPLVGRASTSSEG